MFSAGVRHWRAILDALVVSKKIGGLEKAVVVIIHCLHLITLSGWIKVALDPTTEKPTPEERRSRDRAIEIYVLLGWGVLGVILWVPDKVATYQAIIAGFILFEILLNISSIVFAGKLETAYPPTPSAERSLILFGVNVLQVITIFAIFYRVKLGSTAAVAAFNSTLVFGTVGYPLDGGYLVACQIIVDFILVAVFLGAFVGNLGTRVQRRTGSG